VRAARYAGEGVEVLLQQLRSAVDPLSLVSILDELDKTLVAHFAHEENPGGLYEVLGLRQEKYRTPAGNLLEEHYDILAGLRDLAARARERMRRAEPDLQEAAARLADRLQGRETREDRLAEGMQHGVNE
jgi:hypothetical protein